MGKTDPRKLESYLEQRAAYDGGLRPEVEQLLDSLEEWPRQPALQPPPGFLNRLAGQLQEQQTGIYPREAVGAVGRMRRLLAGVPARLATALAGAVLVVAAAALFVAWFSSLRTGQEAETTPVSATRPVAIGSLKNYPDAPPSLPRYRIEIVPPATTVEEMQAWAEAFGWPDAPLYRDQRNPESVLALSESGAYLSFADPEQGAWPGVGYVRDRERAPALGETLPMAESVAAAETFLREHGLLPDKYLMRALPSPVGAGYGGHPLRLLLVSPDLDGYALYSDVYNPLGATLFIDAAGRVYSAGLMEIRVEEADPVAVQPAEAVVEAFLAGRLEPLAQAFSFPAFEPNMTVYEATPPEHEVGEAVTVLGTDSVRVLLPVAESEPLLIQLVTRQGGVYSLAGDDLPVIATAVGDETLRVGGTITARTGESRWRLEVENWEVVPRQTILNGCAAGPLTFVEDGLWIEAQGALGDVEQGAEYRIADPPSGLEDGQMVEVCAEPLPEPGGALPWTYIYAPPRELGEYDELAGDEAAAAGTLLDVVEQMPSPYEIGDVVRLTGFINLRILLEEEAEQVEVTLFAELPEAGQSHIFPLVAEETLLRKIGEGAHQQFVEVTGTIVEAEGAEGAPPEQAIEVESVEQPWGAQPLQPLVGQVSEGTVDGQQVDLFEEESGDRYVINTRTGSLVRPELRQAAQVWVAGVVHPTERMGGLPLLTIVEWHAAPEGSTLTPGSFPLKREPEVVGTVSGHPVEGALQDQRLLVEEVELAYFVDTEERMVEDGESAIASPVWVVRGQVLPDGNEFIAYLDATAPALPLADYPPRATPYLIEGGDFWLAHTPAGELFAFVPISPEYRYTVGVEECRYDWNAAVGRFVDPCSGDEWELDGRLNLEHSTELWSNRDLDRYETMVEEGVITVHLDRVIPSTSRGE